MKLEPGDKVSFHFKGDLPPIEGEFVQYLDNEVLCVVQFSTDKGFWCWRAEDIDHSSHPYYPKPDTRPYHFASMVVIGRSELRKVR